MSLWNTVRSWFGGNATALRTGDQYSFPNGYNGPSPAKVTEDTALQLSTVWACAKLLCENVATLPIVIYKVQDGERIPDPTSTLSILLNRRPNSRMTGVEFRETMMLNLVMHGNGYARIERNGMGQVIALWPMPAQQMEVKLLEDGTVVYVYTMDNHTAILAADNVLHVKIWGNGLIGMSPLSHARNSIGLGLATEDYASRYFINGGKPGGILTIDQILTTDQRETLKKVFAEAVEGTQNAHKLMLLEAGMKYQQVQINPEDMQMMQSRQFQVEDIARFMGVPSILINSPNTTAWGSGIEQIMLGFYNLNLRPYLDRWEQAVERALLTPAERGKVDVEFDFERLLRGDMRTRASYYSQLAQNGLITRNEGRVSIGLPRSDDENADKLTIQVNMSPIDELGTTDEADKIPEN